MDTFTFKDEEESYLVLEDVLKHNIPVELDFPYNYYHDFPLRLKNLFKKYKTETEINIYNNINMYDDTSQLTV